MEQVCLDYLHSIPSTILHDKMTLRVDREIYTKQKRLFKFRSPHICYTLLTFATKAQFYVDLRSHQLLM